MSYKDFPPYEFFNIVLRNQPQVAHFYAKIWSDHDKKYKLVVEKKNVFRQYLVSPPVFRRKISYLIEEGLLSLVETNHHYEIDFTCCDEEFEPLSIKPTKEKPYESEYSKLTPFG